VLPGSSGAGGLPDAINRTLRKVMVDERKRRGVSGLKAVGEEKANGGAVRVFGDCSQEK